MSRPPVNDNQIDARSGTGGTPIALMRDVTFGYGQGAVLTDFSVSVSPGITGLLGPNGAGKTTIMRLMASVAFPESGSVVTSGVATTKIKELRALRASIGYLPQDASWRESLTVHDFLHYFAWLRHIPKRKRNVAVDVAMARTQMEGLRARRLGTLSGGESRRLMLAQAILHSPALLLLDEPTAGLDPSQRHHFRGVLASLRPKTSTVISTHLLEDVAELADDLLIVDSGTLLFQGSPKALAQVAEDSTGSVAGIHMGYMNVLARAVVTP